MDSSLRLSCSGKTISSGPQTWLLLLTLAVSMLDIQVTVAQENDDYSDWMGELATETHGRILDQTLAEFIFPGSHDAGAYKLTGFACDGCALGGIVETVQGACGNPDGLFSAALSKICADLVSGPTALGAFGVFAPWSSAQNLSIADQLKAGARYFDLRFYRATSNDPLWLVGESEVGSFYTHHTLAGPSSEIIFTGILEFLENHPAEIVILSLSNFKEGSGGMSDESLRAFIGQLDFYLGKYMAEKVMGVPPTLHQVIDSGRRLIVTSDRMPSLSTPMPMVSSGLTEEIIDDDGNAVIQSVTADRLIWPKIDSADFYSVGVDQGFKGYPLADDWKNDGLLLEYMREVAKRPSGNRMFTMGFQMGVDASAKMVIRKYLCALDEFNASGDCPALDDDWDSFGSLEEVAEWTNSKTLPAIIALPRDSVNIVVSDFYNPKFTDEVIKLNRGAARLQTLIRSVSALNDIDPGSRAADFYPKIKAPATGWGQWGGEYLEITDRATINPKWLMVRSVPTSLISMELTIEIWDEDDGDDDDHVDVSKSNSSKSVQENLPIAYLVENQKLPNLEVVVRSSGVDTSCDVLCIADDLATMEYSVSVCEWSTCIDDGAMPVASPTQDPETNDSGWNNTDVEVAWNWRPGTLGAELDGSCPSDVTEWNQDIVTLEGTCADVRGNVGSATYTVLIDKTDPVSEPVQTPAANDLGWNNTDVEIAWNWTDEVSGVAGDDLCAPNSLSLGQGTLTLETTCKDVADNEGNESYTVKVDKSGPVITVSQPAAVEYVHSATLTLDYNVTDSVSGVRTITPDMNGRSTLAGHDLLSGHAIDLLTELPLGPHTFTVNAVDNADNASAPEAVTFTIIVTAQSIIDAVNLFETRGEIGHSAVNSLLSKLNAAREKHERGQCRPAGNMYAAFINQVKAKSGKSISPIAAAILTADAQYLISNCSKGIAK